MAAADALQRVPLAHRTSTKVALAVVAIVLAAVAVAGITIVRMATAQLHQELMDRNVQIARRAAEEIGTIIANARQDLADIGDQLLFLSHEPWARGVLLENQTLQRGIFSTVVLLDSSGSILADNSLGAASLKEFPPEAVRRALQGTSWMSRVTLDDKGLPVLTMVQALSNRLALIALVSLQDIWQIVDDIEAGPNGFAFLVSADGTLVAHRDKRLVLLQDLAAVTARSRSPGTLLVSSPVPGLGWTLSIQQPAAQVFLPVALLVRRSLLLVLVGLGSAALAAFLHAHFFVRPLSELVHGALRIASGDLDHQITPRRADEFGALSRTFNEMLSRLRERSLALEISEQRYRMVTESVRDIVFSMDAEGRILFLNSRAEQLLGLPREWMIGRTLLDFAPAEERARVAAEGATGGRALVPRELTLIGKGGEPLVLELETTQSAGGGSASAFGTVQAGPIYGIGRDITQRKRMEERLRRSERLSALGEVVSTVAHELRNAVTGITASMELARRLGGQSEELRRHLDLVLSESARAERVVQGLLGTSPSPTSRPLPCSLDTAVLDALAARRSLLEAAGVELSVHLSEELPIIMADPDQLKQVFLNLIDNARAALAQVPRGSSSQSVGGPRLSLRTFERGGKACAEVSDNGAGIPPDLLGRVFEPFFTTRRESGGTGLGLAVSLGIIEAAGGDITVQSTPGRGATFTLAMPVTRPVEDTPEPSLRGVRILVVEDEGSVREFVQSYLQGLGCQVDSAADGKAAVGRLSSGDAYSLVISDFRMPDHDGKELYDWIRASKPDLLERMVFITGDSANPATRAFLEETRMPFLLKPVLASALGALVLRMLASRGRKP